MDTCSWKQDFFTEGRLTLFAYKTSCGELELDLPKDGVCTCGKKIEVKDSGWVKEKK